MTTPSPFDRRRFLRWVGQASAAVATAAWLPASRGAFAAEPDASRVAPFFAAIASGDLETVQRLLGRDPGLLRATDAEGRTPLVAAHLAGGPAEITAALRLGMTNEAIELGFVEAILEGEYEIVRDLAGELGDEIHAWHPVGGSAYWAAARFGKSREMWPLNRWGARSVLGHS